MDAHVFRLAGSELLRLLTGARVEKIHQPFPETLVFSLYAESAKTRLVFRPSRQRPFLFFTRERFANPLRPGAQVMRLRKFCAGKRLGEGRLDFAGRALAFALAPQENVRWLVLDLRGGARLLDALPENFGSGPAWPDPAMVTDAPREKNDALWREFTVLTPALRETLAAMDRRDAAALLVDLEAGGGELFLFARQDGAAFSYAAWPLPDTLMQAKGLVPAQAGALPAPASGLPLDPDAFPVLTAVSLADAPRFFREVGQWAQKREEAPVKKEHKRLSRLLAKLDAEEERLRGMCALRRQARALQENLWRFPPDARLDAVELPEPAGKGTERPDGGDIMRIALDPLYTLRENMARMFHASDRGARGLAMLERRRAEVARQRDASVGGAEAAAPAVAERTPARAGRRAPALPKDVVRFVAGSGHQMLRGKNARGNQALLKIGSGHDLWLHSKDGPSAHLIIRRSHPAEEIPEKTLEEAAVLVGLKSWQREDARADIMVAELRHVHGIRGAAPGTVRVDAVLRTLRVSLNPLVEKELLT